MIPILGKDKLFFSKMNLLVINHLLNNRYAGNKISTLADPIRLVKKMILLLKF